MTAFGDPSIFSVSSVSSVVKNPFVTFVTLCP